MPKGKWNYFRTKGGTSKIGERGFRPLLSFFNDSRFLGWLLFDAQHFIVLGLYRFLEHAIRGPGV